jgi:O-acetyl-ADP-ribose deacetylase (regulator of RNase III)
LEEETRPLAPIRPGQAVITSAPNLPNDHVIHGLGPRYGIDQPEERGSGNRSRLQMAFAP